MQNSFSRKFLCVTIAGAFLTACAGSGSGGVPNASSLAAPQSHIGQAVGSGDALTGVYIGRRHDSVQGSSKVQLYLSQSQSALGGVLINSASQGGISMIIAWNLNGNRISGNGIGPPPSGKGLCTFAMTATRKFRRIDGSYSAAYGCAGQTGTFALWHDCYIPNTGSDAIRPATGVRPC